MKRIWMIDDDKTYVFICQRLFQKAGLPLNHLKVLEHGKQAYAELSTLFFKKSKNIPDVILLDLNMPYMNGWDFLEHFRKLRAMAYIEEPHIDMMILSSSISEEDQLQAQKYREVKRFITKPLTLGDIQSFM